MILLKLGKSIRERLASYSFGVMVAGFLIGHLADLSFLKPLIPAALFLMLYPPMLNLEWEEIRKACLEPALPALALAINFLISPLLIFAVSRFLLPDCDPQLVIGVLLFGIVPCGGMVPAYTGMAGGNINLAVAVTAVSLLIGIGLIPLWAGRLIGAFVPVPAALMAKYLVMVIVLPLVVAALTRRVIVRRAGRTAFLSFRTNVQVLAGYGLMLILFIIFVSNGKTISGQLGTVFRVTLSAWAFLVVSMSLSALLGRLTGSSHHDAVALTICTTAKNTAIALALATSLFGQESALAVAACGMTAQLPIMLAYLKLMDAYKRKRPVQISGL